MLFGLGVRELRLFLHQGRVPLRSGGRLRRILGHELGIQLARPFGGRLLGVGIGLGQGLESGSCKSQSPVLRSQYIHSFSIIGDPWL